MNFLLADALFPLLILAAVILIPMIWVFAMYNQLVRLKQFVRDSWANIDVELKRRYDLIPNLVETVKAYAKHEKDTLESVVQLRNKAAANNGTPISQSIDENALLLGMRKLFAVAEAYPELKADQNFLALQTELANTEDRIAAARRFFNGNVRDMNQAVQVFPTNLIAAAFGIQPETFFELKDENERIVPRVDMGAGTQ
jgi:LemA protein